MKLRSIIPAVSISLFLAGAPCAVAGVVGPLFSAGFAPSAIGPGSTGTLSFFITNSDIVGVTDLAFVNSLPAGVTIADPAGAFTDCVDATLSAPAGGSTISFSGGRLGGNATCTVSVSVTSALPGLHLNVSGDLTSSAGNSGPASAELTVATDRPGFSKSFSPASVSFGGRSTLTYTIDNTANNSPAANLRFEDVLPTGIVIADPANASTDCANSVLTANPGTGTISLGPLFFGAGSGVAAGATCTVSVDVVGQAVGMLGSVSGELTSAPPTGGADRSSGSASATLEVTRDNLSLTKSFTDDPALPGGTVTLEYTITNLDRRDAATGITFTDDLNAALSGLVAVGLPASGVCGAGSELSGTSLLTLTGGNLGPGESCGFSLTLQVPPGLTGAFPSTSSSITGDVGGAGVVGSPATDTLFVDTVPILTREFTDDPVGAGGEVTLHYEITNTSTTSPASDIEFLDSLDGIAPGATPTSLPAGGFCGPGSMLGSVEISGALHLSLTGASLAAGDSCSFDVILRIPQGAPGGTTTSSSGVITATIDGATSTGSPASAGLTVVPAVRLTKSFTDDPVLPGETVTLEYTLSLDEFAPGGATAISFTDDLDAVIPGLAAIGLPASDVCGAGSQLSGTSSLSFTGGTLSPGASCSFSVQVQVPTTALPGSFPSESSTVTATVTGVDAIGTVASDDLQVSGLELRHRFVESPVLPGSQVTIEYTLENVSSTVDAGAIQFTHDLGDVLSGLTSVSLPAAGFCGAGSSLVALSGGSFLVMSGGSLMAGEICSFQVTAQLPGGAADGMYRSTTSGLTATMGGSPVAIDPSVASLEVMSTPLTVTKEFTDDPVAAGGTVTLEYTLSNLNPSGAITGIAFTDDLDAALPGLVATGLPATGVCGAGSTISGTGLLSFTGGSLGPAESCTFSITLAVPAVVPGGGAFASTTSSITGTLGSTPVTADPASDDLLVQEVTFTKSFDTVGVPGGTVVLSYTIENLSTTNPLDDIGFADDLDAVIPGMVATGLPSTDVCGSGSTLAGSSRITLSDGSLGPGGSCTFQVTVQLPGTAPSGSFTSTSTDLTSARLPVADPAVATLEMNSDPTLVLYAIGGINEDGTATLTGMIIDPSPTDTFVLDVDWGDPLSPDNMESFDFGASAGGSQSFTLTHHYLDDNPTATGRDRYTVNATLNDNSGGSDSGSRSFLVSNIRPTLILDPNVEVAPGGLATLNGTIVDPGTLDTFALWVDWGDPQSPDNYQSFEFGASATGSQTFTLTHSYPGGEALGGVAISALLLDDEGASAFVTIPVAPAPANRVIVDPPGGLVVDKLEILPDGKARLAFAVEEGVEYMIETSVDLVNWETVRASFIATGPLEQWIDDVSPAGPRRFYRYAKLTR